MTRKEIQRLLRRVLMLVVLTTGLALSASGLIGNNADAAICCDQCFTNYDNCYIACNGNEACEDACYSTLITCHNHCNPDC